MQVSKTQAFAAAQTAKAQTVKVSQEANPVAAPVATVTDVVSLSAQSSTPIALTDTDELPTSYTNTPTVIAPTVSNFLASINSSVGDPTYSAAFDFNHDGHIDQQDLGTFREKMGQFVAAFNQSSGDAGWATGGSNFDFNKDGHVDQQDLGLVRNNIMLLFSNTPSPTARVTHATALPVTTAPTSDQPVADVAAPPPVKVTATPAHYASVIQEFESATQSNANNSAANAQFKQNTLDSLLAALQLGQKS